MLFNPDREENNLYSPIQPKLPPADAAQSAVSDLCQPSGPRDVQKSWQAGSGQNEVGRGRNSGVSEQGWDMRVRGGCYK